MTFRPTKQMIIWALLALCVLAIPVGLISSYTKSSDDYETGLDSLMLRPTYDHILVLDLKGMIMSSGDESAFAKAGSSGWLKSQLRKARKDKHVKAVLLRINSPGGTVATSQEIEQAVVSFRKAGKPLVVSMVDVCASGGYYIACAADKIYALPGTITGSIGVIMNLMNLQEAERKLGIDPEVVKSGKFKDIGSMNRPMTAEERELLESIIKDTYDQFVAAVSEGRHMDQDAVRKIADGRIINGKQALDAGLVDALGGYDEALDGLQELAKKKFGLHEDLRVVDRRMPSLLSALMQAATHNFGEASLIESILPESRALSFNKQPLWLLQ